MTTIGIIGILLVGVGIGVAGLSYWTGKQRKPKAKKAPKWLTTHQLEVLDKIAATGSAGIKLWHTDINMGTIRSLCKRGFADTASAGRIVATRAGKTRLNQPWPAEQPTGDQNGREGSDDTGEAESDEPAASQLG